MSTARYKPGVDPDDTYDELSSPAGLAAYAPEPKVREIFCNERKPDLMKIAAVMDNEVYDIHRGEGGKLYCYVNGSQRKMLCSEARAWMLVGVRLVTHGGVPCEV